MVALVTSSAPEPPWSGAYAARASDTELALRFAFFPTGENLGMGQGSRPPEKRKDEDRRRKRPGRPLFESNLAPPVRAAIAVKVARERARVEALRAQGMRQQH